MTALWRKYLVQRLNDPAGKHDGCRYFVLDPQHDLVARSALEYYADLLGDDQLAEDIALWLSELRQGERP